MTPTSRHPRDLTDEQWALVGPFLPTLPRRPDRRGRPWREHRPVLNGILWVLRTGAPWADLPDRYPSYQTCHRRFQHWVRAGLLRSILAILAQALYAEGYQDLDGNRSPDFVLAFIPIEPAFMLAVTNDSTLFQEAWDRSVLLVSPSTLLFVVRTVAHLWRQEAQTRNAQEIARRGAELYDKLAGFVSDLQNVGTRLKQAREAYDLAESKLATGRGNVIRQAEMLRSLGVKPAKALPASLTSSAAQGGEADTVEVDAPALST